MEETKHEACVKRFAEMSNNQRRKYRIKIYNETKTLCETSELARLLKDPEPSQVNSVTSIPLPPTPTHHTQVIVFNGDCLEVAIELHQRNFHPAVLNMASEETPGGLVTSGSAAQEENLFRRTDYFRHLNKELVVYPFAELGGVYSPQVLIFRGSEADGYCLLETPVHCDMIAVAALRRPQLEICGEQFKLAPEDAEKTRGKIRTMLGLAAFHQNDAVVLSAFGCGAYKNPPVHIAELFREVLEEFSGWFKVIVFAIFDDCNTHREHNPDGNVRPFTEVFKTEVIRDLGEVL